MRFLTLTFLILFAQQTTLAEEAETVEGVSAMCAALISLVAVKQPEPYASLMYEEARWFATWTNPELIKHNMIQTKTALNSDWERVWPIVVDGAAKCSKMKAEAIAG